MKKKPTVNQVKKPIDKQQALADLLKQRELISSKIDILEEDIDLEMNSNLTAKVNKFLKTLSDRELNFINTDVWCDILELFFEKEHQESCKD